MDNEELDQLSDEQLLDRIMATLSGPATTADPYSEDGSYSAAIAKLPTGLRAMAATHHLDISLTLDDIGWHFLNFGEPGLVRQTEAGLHELGLDDIADYFVEAHRIVSPLKAEIKEAEDYYASLESRGLMDRINELTDKAQNRQPTLNGSPVYAAWVRYARAHPERVFVS